tara:strand:- start:318 stop:422 length:105 start_codon:yes stop_codon:yes gene_type:complete
MLNVGVAVLTKSAVAKAVKITGKVSRKDYLVKQP